MQRFLQEKEHLADVGFTIWNNIFSGFNTNWIIKSLVSRNLIPVICERGLFHSRAGFMLDSKILEN